MHYKNYHSQPAVVKICSMFVTQHELGELTDPWPETGPTTSARTSARPAATIVGQPQELADTLEWNCLSGLS